MQEKAGFLSSAGSLFKDSLRVIVQEIVSFLKEGILLPVLLISMIIGLFVCLNIIGGLDHENKPLLYIFVGTGFSAWITFILSQVQSSKQLRKSQTLTQLMQSREAPSYQKNLRLFHAIWEHNNDKPSISYRQYKAWFKGEAVTDPTEREKELDDLVVRHYQLSDKRENIARIEMAEAIRQLINQYEFIAAGINKRVFDELILKGVIRGMFCSFAFNVHPIIKGIRDDSVVEGQCPVWENFVFLYYRWENKPDRREITHLGPSVSGEIVNIGTLHALTRLGLVKYATILKYPI